MCRRSGSLPWLFPMREDLFPDICSRVRECLLISLALTRGLALQLKPELKTEAQKAQSAKLEKMPSSKERKVLSLDISSASIQLTIALFFLLFSCAMLKATWRALCRTLHRARGGTSRRFTRRTPSIFTARRKRSPDQMPFFVDPFEHEPLY